MECNRLLATFVVSSAAVGLMWAGHAGAQAKATPPVVKEWTLAVYLNGHNNLDPFGDTNINQMKVIGSTNDVNVVVLRDRNDMTISSKIYYVTKNATKVVKDYGKNIDMGDWNNMVDFFKYVQLNYPAKHYIFDVWNHGGGWRKQGGNTLRDISWDDGTGHSVTTPQLAQAVAQIKALNGGKNIDILGTDACLMQMAEVGYQLAPSVNVMAASEETEPGDGWDYTGALKFLTANPTAPATEVAAHIQDAYVQANASAGNVQGSAVELAALVAAKPQIIALADALAKFDKLSKDAVKTIISNTKAFYFDDFRDFIDFARLVNEGTTDADLKAIAADAEKAITASVFENYTAGTTMTHANGISVWLPDAATYSSKVTKYKTLTWAADSHWQAFLAALYQ